MKGEILFLAHRLPFPPDRGDKIRSHHVLKRLAQFAKVHVATFADTAGDRAHEGDLAELATSYRLARRDKSMPRAGLEALSSGEPVSLAAFRDAGLAAYVDRMVKSGRISAIYVYSGQMGQYVPADFAGRVVVDLVDVDSAKFGAYAGQAKFPLSWIYHREERLLRAEEQRLAILAKTTVLVSSAEADLLRTRLDDPAKANVRALRNGIDTEFFNPSSARPHRELIAGAGASIVFTGQMDYAPNIAAAQRMVQRIMPEIRQHCPQASFHIVGRAPVADVMALDGAHGCRVWGEVSDVRPFLAGASLVAVPLSIARGVQNKVLEAMAMARPVLLTSGAATGIDAQDGTHFKVEDDDQAFAARAVAIIRDRPAADAMGRAARQFVVSQQGWPAMLSELETIMGLGKSRREARDAA